MAAANHAWCKQKCCSRVPVLMNDQDAASRQWQQASSEQEVSGPMIRMDRPLPDRFDQG